MLVRLALAVLVLGISAAGAQAKGGPLGLQLCGAGACVAIGQPVSDAVFEFGTQQPAVPPGASSYYALHWRVDGADSTAYWIPGAAVLRWLGGELNSDGAWTAVDPATAAALGRAAASLQPFSTPTLERVLVGGRVARNPNSYVRLFGSGRLTQTWPVSGWIFLDVTADAPNPWTQDYDLRISRRGPYVWRDWTVFRISPALARRARRGLSLS